VDAWTAGCAQLSSCETLKKDLPKHPKCLLKPKLTAVATSSQVQLEDLDGQTDDNDEGVLHGEEGDGVDNNKFSL
jgi:hypothetical protein